MPRIDPRIVADLKRETLLKEGHWSFLHGGHSRGLIDRDHLLSDPVTASHLAYAIAKQFFTNHIETVATPSIWGAGLALLVGGFLDPKAKIAYATPSADGPTLASQIEDLVREKRVLLVDNIIRSGETMTRFYEMVGRLDGEVIGIATLWNLAEPEIAGHAVFGLLNTDYEVFPDGRCPMCAAGSTPDPAPY
ncbi:MAG TPA: phosphoribosyltransferase family protein [Thermomicrobiales bacterium]|nr:phosphoribosyltransferase family protein [Thermomicrobiales bacterium]